MWCPSCNSKLKIKAKFCPECGATIVRKNEPYRNKSVVFWKILFSVLISLILLVVIAGSLLVYINSEISEEESAFSDNPEAISIASQSVVKLNCYNKSGELLSTGSGFAYFANNILVTNYHVIEGGTYAIRATTENGLKFNISHVLAIDKDQDIAILYTETPHNLTLLHSGNSDTLQKGEKVVAIGSPLGLMNSVSAGVFSGYGYEDDINVLHFTASISSGSSGGVLFNNAGEVLGITFASYSAGQNLNLAIPIEYVERLYSESDASDIITIEEFYELFLPIYTVDQVINAGKQLEGKDFYIKGYVDSYGEIFRDNDTIAMWCDVRSSQTDGMRAGEIIKLSSGVYLDPSMNLIINLARARRLKESGTLALFKCEYKTGDSGITLLVIEYMQ